MLFEKYKFIFLREKVLYDYLGNYVFFILINFKMELSVNYLKLFWYIFFKSLVFSIIDWCDNYLYIINY